MPNTLAHIGAQGVLTKLVWRDAEPRWILLGCIIPDVPWIVQRVLIRTTDIDPMVFRPYLDYQASLFGCIFLSLAVASLAQSHRRVSLILTFNALLHLALDAVETKWGNGVHFFAPVSWAQTNWGLFWPDSLAAFAITAIGAAFVVLTWKRSAKTRPTFAEPSIGRALAFVALLALYVTTPFFLRSDQIASDPHFMTARTEEDALAGQAAAFDRARIEACDYGICMIAPSGRRIAVENLSAELPAIVSLKGTFLNGGSVRVTEHHVHLPFFRDGASYAGIVVIVLFWIWPMVRFIPRQESHPADPRPEARA